MGYTLVCIDMSNSAIKFSPPDITELEIGLVCDALKSGWITTGPRTKEFESKISDYCGVSKTVCFNSATAALELTLRVLGIGKGDEVITSAYTYTASASVIDHVGARIVLCDTAKDSYEMDYEKLPNLITKKTKAIIAIDLAGVICDYEKLFVIVKEKKKLFAAKNDLQKQLGRIAVIADAAHSFGATQKNKRAGEIADFSCFSFHAVKNLTTAEGGAVAINFPQEIAEKLYEEYMLWSLHGQNKDALKKSQLGAWEYDIVKLGYKYNMTDIAAAIGLAQLARYEVLLAKRKTIVTQYDNAFKGTSIVPLSHYGDLYSSSGHLYLTRILGKSEKERNSVIEKMTGFGIATNVHYKPLPLFTAYKKLGFDIKNFPNAYAQYQNELTLPLHTMLLDRDVDFIAQKYLKSVKGV